MSFSFNFGAADLVEGHNIYNDDTTQDTLTAKAEQGSASAANGVNANGGGSAKAHTLPEMLQALPSKVSYSRTRIPTPTTNSGADQIYIYRRDLFDARFQMIDEEDDAQHTGKGDWADVMAGAASDLVPGVYEGGLKTWECSLDLVGVLSSMVEQDANALSGRRKIVEIGCGTAYPSLYALTQVMKHRMSAATELRESIHFQLCDFNEQVLRLVTVPNVLLNWYFNVSTHGRTQEVSAEGELEITDDLLHDFAADLKSCGVTIELYSGFWEGLSVAGAFTQPSPDLVLTSETIYSLDTMPLLIDTLRAACSASSPSAACFVAAKVVYFGVGGGVYAFQQELNGQGAQSTTVWKSDTGVSRVVLQVQWS